MNLDKEFFNTDLKDYSSWQEISREIDDKLAINVEAIEKGLEKRARQEHGDIHFKNLGPLTCEGQQTWIGLSADQLQSTYKEMYDICSYDFNMPMTGILDLGASYGRLGLVWSTFSKEIPFLGLEYIKERVDLGNSVFQKLEISNCSLRQKDITKLTIDEIKEFNIFFIYDFGNRSDIDKVLCLLRESSSVRPISIIARGRGVRSIISNWHPWAGLNSIDHFETYSIYRSL